jgi:hypothetical protein
MCCENLQKKLEESQVLVEAKKQKVQKTQLEIIVKIDVKFYIEDMKLVEIVIISKAKRF